MTRRSAALAFAFLLSACVTSRPIHQVGAPDPVTDPRFTGDARAIPVPPATGDLDSSSAPSTVGAVDEAARESRERAEAGARTGRRVGIVAGTLAAVFGGPHHDSLDDMVVRYVITRDVATVTGAIIGAVKGGKEGAKRGSELDLQFAELKKIDGLDVTRPTPDRIDVYVKTVPTHETPRRHCRSLCRTRATLDRHRSSRSRSPRSSRCPHRPRCPRVEHQRAAQRRPRGCAHQDPISPLTRLSGGRGQVETETDD